MCTCAKAGGRSSPHSTGETVQKASRGGVSPARRLQSSEPVRRYPRVLRSLTRGMTCCRVRRPGFGASLSAASAVRASRAEIALALTVNGRPASSRRYETGHARSLWYLQLLYSAAIGNQMDVKHRSFEVEERGPSTVRTFGRRNCQWLSSAAVLDRESATAQGQMSAGQVDQVREVRGA
ncbi:hypothetical protein BC628DRAFT_570358 [Trametes gibbosa]|nr:hypothetical protein BC628DRAFT_570358 [Trametes gibbosa]